MEDKPIEINDVVQMIYVPYCKVTDIHEIDGKRMLTLTLWNIPENEVGLKQKVYYNEKDLR